MLHATHPMHATQVRPLVLLREEIIGFHSFISPGLPSWAFLQFIFSLNPDEFNPYSLVADAAEHSSCVADIFAAASRIFSSCVAYRFLTPA